VLRGVLRGVGGGFWVSLVGFGEGAGWLGVWQGVSSEPGAGVGGCVWRRLLAAAACPNRPAVRQRSFDDL